MPNRNQQPIQPRSAAKVGLPVRPFLYSLDQLAVILDVSQTILNSSYIHFETRSIGAATKDQMIARNIAPGGEKPEWRVAEQELIRWMRRKGFKFYDRAFLGY